MQLATENLHRIESRITMILAAHSVGVENEEAKTIQEQKAVYKGRQFVKDWGRRLGIREFKFECTPEEWAYVSMPRDAVYIHSVIADALGENECKVFIDAFACVGGDTVAVMNQFRGAQVFAVQRGTTTEEIERFGRLTQNIEYFQRIIPDRPHPVSLNGVDIKTFLDSLTPDQEVSVLYLDPPWALGEDPNAYSPPIVTNHLLTTDVWTPLREKKINPLLIVLKLPGRPTDPLIEDWPVLGVRYEQIAFLTPSQKFAVYILRRVD